MKRCILLLFIVILLSSCADERSWKNPYDPEESISPAHMPSNLSLSSLNYQTIKLSWKDNSNKESAYLISKKINNEQWQDEYVKLNANITTYTDTVLAVNTHYYYKVQAVFDEVLSPPLQDSIYHAYQLAQVNNLLISQSAGSALQISWNDSNPCEEGFYIDKQTDNGEWVEKYAQVSANTHFYNDTQVSLNHLYSYRIYAFAGDQTAEKSSVSIDYRLLSPTDCQISYVQAHTLLLNWSDNNTLKDGFKIARKIDNGEWDEDYAEIQLKKIDLKNRTTYSWQDDHVLINHNYQYKIYTLFNNLTSVPAFTSINYYIYAVSNLQISSISTTSVQLSWQDNNLYEQNYIVNRKKGDESWQNEYAILNANTSQWTDNNAPVTNQYVYQIITRSDSVSTPATEASILHQIIPTAPENLNITPEAVNTLKIQWQDTNTLEEGYKIDRKVGNNEWEENIAQLNPNTTQWLDSQAPSGQTYTYRVYAYSADINSAYAEKSYHFSLNPVSELEIIPINLNQLKLQWAESNLFEEAYVISRKAGTGAWNNQYAVLPTNSTSWTDQNITFGQTYAYKVRAKSLDNYSVESEISINYNIIAPVDLYLVNLTNTQVQLKWQNNHNFGDEITIARKAGDNEWVNDYASIDADLTEWTDNIDENINVYQYKIRVKFSTFTSPFSNSAYYLKGFRLLQSGNFQMGNAQFPSSTPVHSVSLQGFFISAKETTQNEWYEVMNTIPSSSHGSGPEFPVYQVSWYDALVYCNKKSINEGLSPVYALNGVTNPDSWGTIPTTSNPEWNAITCNWNANGYRLPTEAEWEFASRGGTWSENYEYAGSNRIGNVAWYLNNSANITHQTATKQMNEAGIYDMSGNVYEWCWDWYAPYENVSQTNPTGPDSGTTRSIRGGSFLNEPQNCLSTFRLDLSPESRLNYTGFRIVRKVLLY